MGTYDIEPLTPAYLAALIDGEGCIRIGKTLYKGKPKHYSVVIRIQMLSQHVLREVAIKFGGHFYGPYMRKSREGKQPVWQWSVQGAEAHRILRLVRPWLRVKGYQADAALEFFRGGFLKENGRLTPEEICRREGLYQHVKALNVRGL